MKTSLTRSTEFHGRRKHEESHRPLCFCGAVASYSREVKHDVYGKRQTAGKKLLPSLFGYLYSRMKLIVFAMNSRKSYSTCVAFCVLYLRIRRTELKVKCDCPRSSHL